MNQGKLEVIKQKMVRVNVDILGISEIKWTRMGEFNSDDHYIYYCGQESLRRNGVALIVNERVWNVVLGCNLKNDRMISVHFQGKPFTIIVIQVYAMTSNGEEAEIEWVLWRPTRFSRTISPHFSYQPGEFIFQCHIFFPFHTAHGVLKARRLKWFAIPFSSGSCFIRTLHHDHLGWPCTTWLIVSLSWQT